MSYKIAVASSDGVNIDISFGGADSFHIYKVSGKEYCFSEKREVPVKENLDQSDKTADEKECAVSGGCKGGGNGCGPGAGGCGGTSFKVELISDCRCIVCKKIGFHITKQLEKKAISGFDVECSIEEALKKITNYFDKMDSHQSLRGLVNH